MRPVRVLEGPEVFEYLLKRGILEPYRKAKRAILEWRGHSGWTLLKKRRPHTVGIWYFRIDRKYRAIGRFSEDGEFLVFRIDDHQ